MMFTVFKLFMMFFFMKPTLPEEYTQIQLTCHPDTIKFTKDITTQWVEIKSSYTGTYSNIDLKIVVEGLPNFISYTLTKEYIKPGESTQLLLSCSMIFASSGTYTAYVKAYHLGKEVAKTQLTIIVVKEEAIGKEGEPALGSFPHVKVYSDMIIRKVSDDYQIVVKKGAHVNVRIFLKVTNGDYWYGYVRVEVRKDMVSLPDQHYVWLPDESGKEVYLTKDGMWIDVGTFTAVDVSQNWTPFAFRSYFFKIYVSDDGKEWKCIYNPTNPSGREYVQVEE